MEYNEIEDMRDWFIDLCAEFLAKSDTLSQATYPALVETVRNSAEAMHQDGIKVIAGLDAILVRMKRENQEPD